MNRLRHNAERCEFIKDLGAAGRRFYKGEGLPKAELNVGEVPRAKKGEKKRQRKEREEGGW